MTQCHHNLFPLIISNVYSIHKCLNLKALSINLPLYFAKVYLSVCLITFIDKHSHTVSLGIMITFEIGILFASINCWIRWSENISSWLLNILSLIALVIVIAWSYLKMMVRRCYCHLMLRSCECHLCCVGNSECFSNTHWWYCLKVDIFNTATWG